MVVRHITLGSASSLPGSVPCLPSESASLPFLGRTIAKPSRPELLNAPSSASAPSGPSTKRQRLPAVVPTEFGAPSVGNGLAREATLAKRMWNAQGASVDRMVKHLEEAEVHEWCMRCLGAGLVDQCGSGPGGCFPSTFGQPRGKFGKGWLARGSPDIVSASGVTFLNNGLSSMMLTGCRQLCPLMQVGVWGIVDGRR